MDSLISTDRCDAAGEPAHVRVNKGELTLDFCSHHFTKFGEALDKDGWGISIDTRDLLSNRAVGAEVG